MWKGELCPRIEKKLEEHKKFSSSCHVIWNGSEGYELVHGEDTFVVDVREWTCTCGVWDLIGIPCPHAVYVENHGPSPTPFAPPSFQTSHVPPSSQISSPSSSQTSHVPPSSQIPYAPQSAPTMVFMPTPSIQQLSELDSSSTTVAVPVNKNKGTSNMREHLGRPSQVLLSRPHTRSFTKPLSQPTSTTTTPLVVVPLSASSGPDATATVSPEARLPKLTIKRHPPKN
ncbi:hypothetical protein V6N13_130554 [Hibiscus sabdariffa]